VRAPRLAQAPRFRVRVNNPKFGGGWRKKGKPGGGGSHMAQKSSKSIAFV